MIARQKDCDKSARYALGLDCLARRGAAPRRLLRDAGFLDFDEVIDPSA
jgi:hypothetical protein